MPIVVMNDVVNLSSEYRNRRHDFPTPESPINNSLTRTSKALVVLLAVVLVAVDDDMVEIPFDCCWCGIVSFWSF